MNTRLQTDRVKLQNLKHNENCVINWIEEGGCEVYRIWDVFVVFTVPQYGGEPMYEDTYHVSQIDTLLDFAYSIT